VEDWERDIVSERSTEAGFMGSLNPVTSKFSSSEPLHGGHGEFVSSLAALCLLTITSRHHLHRSSNSLTFHLSEPVTRLIPIPEAHGTSLSRHGTRVLVRNLFGNMPVRVKQRALLQESIAEENRLWEELKLNIISLLIAWHKPMKVTLVDLKTNRPTVLTTTLSAETYSQPSLSTNLFRLLTDAGFVSSSTMPECISASASSKNVQIKGFIALTPWPTKRYQFISLGIQPLEASGSGVDLYNLINSIFATSSFGTIVDEAVNGKGSPNAPSFLLKDLRPARKNVEKWPAFYLRISIQNDPNSFHKDVRNASVLAQIAEVFEALASAWLATHGYKDNSKQSPVKRNRSVHSQYSPNKSQKSLSNQSTPSSSVKTTRSGHNAALIESYTKRKEAQDAGLGCDCTSTVAHQALRLPQENQLDPQIVSDDAVMWMDPYSKRKLLINSRTGMAVNNTSTAETGNMPPLRLTLRPNRHHQSSTNSEWFDSIGEKWQDPIFTASEKPITRVTAHTAVDRPEEESISIFSRMQTKMIQNIQREDIIDSKLKLSRKQLLSARVIAQVNKQFILVSVQTEAFQEALVAVDQHAADERCRVEDLMKELCMPPTNEKRHLISSLGFKSIVQFAELPKPLHFQLLLTEIEHFRNHAADFAKWGILYNIMEDDPTSGKNTLVIITLPAVIAERARSEPELLISTLRSELWIAVERGARVTSATLPTEDNECFSSDWLRMIGSCPDGIVKLINSRACRSAIMFNDSLSLQECEKLVQKLSHCALPFQCAHGRPSMIPLVQLSSKHDEDTCSFINSYISWKLK
jgi:DNA mismatch repair protein MLH3